MPNWFNDKMGEPFELFGTSHIISIAVYFLALILLLLYSHKVMNNKKLYSSIRWNMFIILIFSELSFQYYTYINGIWSISSHIPLHLCGIASIIAAIALVTQQRTLIIFAYFIGIVPAFLAIITPDLTSDFPQFRFWKFFIHHITISLASIFLIMTSKIQLTWKMTITSYLGLLLYAGIIGFFVNPVINSNYLYLAGAPSTSTSLDFLGNGIWYYFNLCLLGLIVFIVMYLLYHWVASQANHNTEKH